MKWTLHYPSAISVQHGPFTSTFVLVCHPHATYFISSFCKITQISPLHSCVFHDKYSVLYSCLLPVEMNESFICLQFSHTPAFVSFKTHWNWYQVHCKFHCWTKWSVECCNCYCFLLLIFFILHIWYICLELTEKPHQLFFFFLLS